MPEPQSTPTSNQPTAASPPKSPAELQAERERQAADERRKILGAAAKHGSEAIAKGLKGKDALDPKAIAGAVVAQLPQEAQKVAQVGVKAYEAFDKAYPEKDGERKRSPAGAVRAGLDLLGEYGGQEVKQLLEARTKALKVAERLGIQVPSIEYLVDFEWSKLGDKLADLKLEDLVSLDGLLDSLQSELLKFLPPGLSGNLKHLQTMLGEFGLPTDVKGAYKALKGDSAEEAAAKAEKEKQKQAQEEAEKAKAAKFTPGVWVEGHYIATLGKAFASHDGLPLAPGPGARTVISEGCPVWRVKVDQHLCKIPAPGHGPGTVLKGATLTYAEGSLIARYGDMLIGEAAPNKIIDAVTARSVRAALARAKAAEAARAKAQSGQSPGSKAADENPNRRGPLTREEREARKKELQERRAREKRAEARNAKAREESKSPVGRGPAPEPAPTPTGSPTAETTPATGASPNPNSPVGTGPNPSAAPTPGSNTPQGGGQPGAAPPPNPNSPVGTGPDPVSGPTPPYPSEQPNTEARIEIGPPNECGGDGTPLWITRGLSTTSDVYIGDICNEHDRDYGKGGTERDRAIADARLRDGIRKRLIENGVHPVVAAVKAQAYHDAVSAAGPLFFADRPRRLTDAEYEQGRKNYDETQARMREQRARDIEEENARRRRLSDEAARERRRRDGHK